MTNTFIVGLAAITSVLAYVFGLLIHLDLTNSWDGYIYNWKQLNILEKVVLAYSLLVTIALIIVFIYLIGERIIGSMEYIRWLNS